MHGGSIEGLPFDAVFYPGPAGPGRWAQQAYFQILETGIRLVIYPGIVPHSGEIAGDWIHGEERFRYPRLTQRFTFFPAA